jgi:hypothetical protein
VSTPRTPPPVKLVASLFSAERPLMEEAISFLSNAVCPVDWVSGEMAFDKTDYYTAEMGWPLFRRFVSFAALIPFEDLVRIKLLTNEYESKTGLYGRRRINIDPGCLSAERLILATGKNYIHRVYLGSGIYADLTLIYREGSFRKLEWTYPDYASPEVTEMFNTLRGKYLQQLRREKGD